MSEHLGTTEQCYNSVSSLNGRITAHTTEGVQALNETIHRGTFAWYLAQSRSSENARNNSICQLPVPGYSKHPYQPHKEKEG